MSLYQYTNRLPRHPLIVPAVDEPRVRTGVRTGARYTFRVFAALLGWTKEQHRQHAHKLELAAVQAQLEYARALDYCAREELGRPFGLFDYKISGIGQEWLGRLPYGTTDEQRAAYRRAKDARCDLVRRLAHAHGELRDAAFLHRGAARLRTAELGRLDGSVRARLENLTRRAMKHRLAGRIPRAVALETERDQLLSVIGTYRLEAESVVLDVETGTIPNRSRLAGFLASVEGNPAGMLERIERT